MFVVLILIVILFGIGAGVALVRGLLAFAREGDLIKSGGDPLLKRSEQQNRMMTQRVIFQALAVAGVALLGLIFAAR
jgi:hypothetical protein